LEQRRASHNAVVREAAATGLGLKAAPITPAGKGDVGWPNAILREAIDGKVLLSTGRRLPGVWPAGGAHSQIAVVPMAVDDAYGAEEWREQRGGDEIAYRTWRISRRTCRAVADFSFQMAQKNGAKVFGGPKYTVSPGHEGMFKEELDAAYQRPRRYATSRNSSTRPWPCC
jgi:isocitrate dehydrogenase (NAD+)